MLGEFAAEGAHGEERTPHGMATVLRIIGGGTRYQGSTSTTCVYDAKSPTRRMYERGTRGGGDVRARGLQQGPPGTAAERERFRMASQRWQRGLGFGGDDGAGGRKRRRDAFQTAGKEAFETGPRQTNRGSRTDREAAGGIREAFMCRAFAVEASSMTHRIDCALIVVSGQKSAALRVGRHRQRLVCGKFGCRRAAPGEECEREVEWLESVNDTHHHARARRTSMGDPMRISHGRWQFETDENEFNAFFGFGAVAAWVAACMRRFVEVAVSAG